MSELYHHGILGQKWGVRRAEHYPLDPEDHSAEQIRKNPEIRRQLIADKKAAKAERKSEKRLNRVAKIASKLSREGRRKELVKNTKQMTDDEIKQAISRLQLEKQYIDLTTNISPEQQKRDGLVKQVLADALKKVGTQAATVAFSFTANKLASTIAGKEITIVDPMSGGVPKQFFKKIENKPQPGASKQKTTENSTESNSEKGSDKEPPPENPKPDAGQSKPTSKIQEKQIKNANSEIVPVKYTTSDGKTGIRYAPRESVRSLKSTEQIVPMVYKTSDGRTVTRQVAQTLYEEKYSNSKDEERRRKALDMKPKKR